MSRRVHRAPARPAAVVAVMALAAALASCSDDGAGEPDDAVSSSPSSAGPSEDATPGTPPSQTPVGPPASFDAAAATTFPEVDVREVEITDTHALVLTPQRLVGRTLPDLDLAFEVPPSAGNITDFLVSEDSTSVYLVEVGTVPGTGTEVGEVVVTLRRADLETGEVSDVGAARVRQDPSTGGAASTARIGGFVGDVAVVDLWADPSDGTNPFGEATARHRTIALDTAGGDVVWTRPGARPLSVSDVGVVLSTGRPRRPGPVVGVNPDDGGQRWTVLPNTTQARFVGIDGDALVMSTSRNDRPRGRLVRVDVATGAVTGDPGEAPSWNLSCWSTEDAGRAVCAVDGRGQAFGWDLQRNRTTWRLPGEGRLGPVVTDVFDDVAYGQLGDGRAVTIDAISGDDIADSTTGGAQEVGLWGGMSVLDGSAVFLPAVE